jgi:hypothetical protein
MPTQSVTVYRPTFLIPLGIILFVISFCSFCSSCLVANVPSQTQTTAAQPEKEQAQTQPKKQATYPPCPIAERLDVKRGSSYPFYTVEQGCWSGMVQADPYSPDMIIITKPTIIGAEISHPNNITYYAHCANGREFAVKGVAEWSAKKGCEQPIVFRGDSSMSLFPESKEEK